MRWKVKLENDETGEILSKVVDERSATELLAWASFQAGWTLVDYWPCGFDNTDNRPSSNQS